MSRTIPVFLMLAAFFTSFSASAEKHKGHKGHKDHKNHASHAKQAKSAKAGQNKGLSVQEVISGKLSGDARAKALGAFKKKYKNRRKLKLSYYSIYSEFVPKIGVKQIGAHLEKLNPSCHHPAHALGKIVGESIPDLKTGMQVCGNTCTYACVHGVFKVYFTRLGKNYSGHGHHGHHDKHHGHHSNVGSGGIELTKKDLRKFARDVKRTCKGSKSVVADFFRGNCAHAVGHAMGKISKSTRLATNYCRVFKGKPMQYYCETGVFMELGYSISKRLFKPAKRHSEQIELAVEYCGKNSNYPSACLRFLLGANKSLGQVARFSFICSKQKGRLRKHCYNAMGYFTRWYVYKYPLELKYVCSLNANRADRESCISGVTFMKKDHEYRKDVEFACKHLGDKKSIALCNSQINRHYYKLDNRFLNRIL